MKTTVTYAERVTIHHLGEVYSVYICVTEHSIFMVKPNLKCLVHDGGEIFYAHIVRTASHPRGGVGIACIQ